MNNGTLPQILWTSEEYWVNLRAPCKGKFLIWGKFSIFRLWWDCNGFAPINICKNSKMVKLRWLTLKLKKSCPKKKSTEIHPMIYVGEVTKIYGQRRKKKPNILPSRQEKNKFWREKELRGCWDSDSLCKTLQGRIHLYHF